MHIIHLNPILRFIRIVEFQFVTLTYHQENEMKKTKQIPFLIR
jgi:hypothetical protein